MNVNRIADATLSPEATAKLLRTAAAESTSPVRKQLMDYAAGMIESTLLKPEPALLTIALRNAEVDGSGSASTYLEVPAHSAEVDIPSGEVRFVDELKRHMTITYNHVSQTYDFVGVKYDFCTIYPAAVTK